MAFPDAQHAARRVRILKKEIFVYQSRLQDRHLQRTDQLFDRVSNILIAHDPVKDVGHQVEGMFFDARMKHRWHFLAQA